MQNFFQPANTINLAVPHDVNSGDGFFLGKIFAIATMAAKSGTVVPALVEGAVALTKAAAYNPTAGTAATYDDVAKQLISGAGTVVGYVILTNDPDDATKAIVKLIPDAA